MFTPLSDEELRELHENKSTCKELAEALEQKPFFDVSGGCGVDLSEGLSNCMDASGVWFKFCPFCGKKIRRKRTQEGTWEWSEVEDG